MIKKYELAKVLFIVGNSRSGTTMLSRILGNHSLIHSFNELHFFEQQINPNKINDTTNKSHAELLNLLERLLTSSRDGYFANVISGNYKAEAEKIISSTRDKNATSIYEAFLHYETNCAKKIIPCEQTPRYLFFAKEILKAFPDARMVNIIRDPRDVLLSQKNKWKRRYLGAKNIPIYEAMRAWVNYHPYTITRLWVSAVRTAKTHENKNQFLTLKFEDILENPDDNIKVLCEFIGVEFENTMLNIPQIGSSNSTDKVRKFGIDSARANSWRSEGGLTRTEISICQNIATSEMVSLGYKIDPAFKIPFWTKWSSMVICVFKLTLALLLNIKRSKNIIQSIRLRLLTPNSISKQ